MKIYDCFTFFDELDILEFRMRLLNPYVDYFVISELGVTYRGEKTEPIFLKNRERFSEYLDKVIYVTSDFIPEDKGDGDWSIEFWQRNCIMKGLASCTPEDIVMISDVDEIPHPKIFKHFDKINVYPNLRNNTIRKIFYALGTQNRNHVMQMLKKGKLEDIIEFCPVACHQRFFYYFLNCESLKSEWNGTVICKYKNLCMPQKMRDIRSKIPVIKNAGWHFSNLGGLKKIKSKLKDSMNDLRQEIIDKAKTIMDDDNYLLECIEDGKDIFGRKGKSFEFKFILPEGLGIPHLECLFPNYKEYIHMK